MLLSMLLLHSLPCLNAVVTPLLIVALYFFDAAIVIACSLHSGVHYVDATSNADLSPVYVYCVSSCFLVQTLSLLAAQHGSLADAMPSSLLPPVDCCC